MRLTALDKLIYQKMMESAVKQKTKHISIDLQDLYKLGYSGEDIEESMSNLAYATIHDIHDA